MGGDMDSGVAPGIFEKQVEREPIHGLVASTHCAFVIHRKKLRFLCSVLFGSRTTTARATLVPLNIRALLGWQMGRLYVPF